MDTNGNKNSGGFFFGGGGGFLGPALLSCTFSGGSSYNLSSPRAVFGDMMASLSGTGRFFTGGRLFSGDVLGPVKKHKPSPVDMRFETGEVVVYDPRDKPNGRLVTSTTEPAENVLTLSLPISGLLLSLYLGALHIVEKAHPKTRTRRLQPHVRCTAA